jgi:uncharacterized protein YwgA
MIKIGNEVSWTNFLGTHYGFVIDIEEPDALISYGPFGNRIWLSIERLTNRSIIKEARELQVGEYFVPEGIVHVFLRIESGQLVGVRSNGQTITLNEHHKVSIIEDKTRFLEEDG